MAWLILGLVLFLGAHSTRIFAENWRQAILERLGEKAYKGVYTLVSLVGFGLMVFGFDQVRWDSPLLWAPPVWVKHAAALLMLLSLVLLASAYTPRNAIKVKLHHPMVLSVKVWALSHLLANGNLADVVLFGSFLIWAVLNFRAARARDRLHALPEDASEEANPSIPAPNVMATLVTLAVGGGLWALFTFVLHAKWIGVAPLS